MLLRHIGLQLNSDEYPFPDPLGSNFGFQTRSVCNFVRRRVRAGRIKTEGFNNLCVEGSRDPKDECPIVPEHAVAPQVYFDQVRYERTQGNDRQEFFIEMLELGFTKCARHHDIPLQFLRDCIQEFRAGGYKNQWVHQSKRLGRYGFRATLRCELTMTEFVLTLSVAKRDKVVFEKDILHEVPDEICFDHKFKDIKVVDDTLVVTKKYDSEMRNPLFTIPLAELADSHLR